jgi:nucleoid DNA-binding protein
MTIETGGTSCRISIGMKEYNEKNELSKLDVIKFWQVDTKSPEETINMIFECVKEDLKDVEEVGIASFGPLCFDE